MTASNPGKLYLVPTPIGNLEDITFRAVRILKEADLVLCEDTRRAAVLFQKYGIRTPRESYHEHNKFHKTPGVIRRIREGGKIALISEAGTPGISDPGFHLAREVIASRLLLEVLPGPSAVITALVGSGLPTDRFAFEGFLPAKKGRRARLESLKDDPRTLIFYEAPHRLKRTLEDLLNTLGDRQAAWGREISKIYEEFERGELSGLLRRLEVQTPKGEFTLIVEGCTRRLKKNQSERI